MSNGRASSELVTEVSMTSEGWKQIETSITPSFGWKRDSRLLFWTQRILETKPCVGKWNLLVHQRDADSFIEASALGGQPK